MSTSKPAGLPKVAHVNRHRRKATHEIEPNLRIVRRSNQLSTDFGHQQSIVASESAQAMFRGFEAMRKIQEEVAQRGITEACGRGAEAAR